MFLFLHGCSELYAVYCFQPFNTKQIFVWGRSAWDLQYFYNKLYCRPIYVGYMRRSPCKEASFRGGAGGVYGPPRISDFNFFPCKSYFWNRVILLQKQCIAYRVRPPEDYRNPSMIYWNYATDRACIDALLQAVNLSLVPAVYIMQGLHYCDSNHLNFWREHIHKCDVSEYSLQAIAILMQRDTQPNTAGHIIALSITYF